MAGSESIEIFELHASLDELKKLIAHIEEILENSKPHHLVVRLSSGPEQDVVLHVLKEFHDKFSKVLEDKSVVMEIEF